MVLDKYILNDYPNPSFPQSNPRTSLQYTRIQHDRPNNLHKISALHEEDLSWCSLRFIFYPKNGDRKLYHHETDDIFTL